VSVSVSRRLLLLATSTALAASALVACAPGAPPPIAEPRRPEPHRVARIVEERPRSLDCAPIRPTDGSPPRTYKERGVEEAAANAEAGIKLLVEAEEPSMPQPEKEKRITQAVQKFFIALEADPYNARATYNLAAAYARIGRNQCALNLLARLAEMSSWPSQKAHLDDIRDRIFGRHKWKAPDPDFDRLRGDARFREIVKSI
jgi:tetratricopeptide (TPR) repeat protein